jgi:hypothetical protein
MQIRENHNQVAANCKLHQRSWNLQITRVHLALAVGKGWQATGYHQQQIQCQHNGAHLVQWTEHKFWVHKRHGSMNLCTRYSSITKTWQYAVSKYLCSSRTVDIQLSTECSQAVPRFALTVKVQDNSKRASALPSHSYQNLCCTWNQSEQEIELRNISMIWVATYINSWSAYVIVTKKLLTAYSLTVKIWQNGYRYVSYLK